ncbi:MULTISPECIES: hypothetical protein [Cyanophyceae]|uniref:hypothetical protein n=1 Tax=Cyanophyceae TaxID=3028117 RepID=UPI0016893166|nr:MULTISPECIES: hypothetical protein [Cyanophyceae]MBD1918913.1 hypothetical protein [Phormidium sp. FACHB-77]MBD2033245.1 hypothetical protein [Phormidium sp. FACHB-322]MBD2053822.1 hypothetical protein [Leptolyngbya sp. FACHB-60]
MQTTEEMLRQALSLLQATQQRLTDIEARFGSLEATLRATDWVDGPTLAQLLHKRPRWPQHWRKRGVFTTENGCVRQVGAGSKPRYEYHLERCEQQWTWWSQLPPEGQAAFLGGDGEVA